MSRFSGICHGLLEARSILEAARIMLLESQNLRGPWPGYHQAEKRCGFVVVWEIIAGGGEDRQTSAMLSQLGAGGWAGGWMNELHFVDGLKKAGCAILLLVLGGLWWWLACPGRCFGGCGEGGKGPATARSG